MQDPRRFGDSLVRLAEKGDGQPRILAARSELADDPVVGPLLTEFVRCLASRMMVLRRAEEQADWKAVAKFAHQLAGACGGYGFPEMGKTAAKIEMLAGDQQSSKALTDLIVILGSMCESAARG